MLALSKPLYLSVLALFWLVPRDRFPGASSRRLTFVTIVASSVVACALWSVLTAWAITPGPAIDLARHAADISDAANVAPRRQAAFVLTHPLASLGVLAATISTFEAFYLESFVGVLGWSTRPCPSGCRARNVLVTIAVALLGSPVRVTRTARCLALAIFALTGIASLFVLYVYWSAVGMR